MNNHSVLSPNSTPVGKSASKTSIGSVEPNTKPQPHHSQTEDTNAVNDNITPSEFKQALDNEEYIEESENVPVAAAQYVVEENSHPIEADSFLLAEHFIVPGQGNQQQLVNTSVQSVEATVDKIIDANRLELDVDNRQVQLDPLLQQIGPVNQAEPDKAGQLQNNNIVINTQQLSLNTSKTVLSNTIAGTEVSLLVEEAVPDTRFKELSLLANEKPTITSAQLSTIATNVLTDKPASTVLSGTTSFTNTVSSTSSHAQELTITTPFNKANWGEAVSDKILWISGKGIKEAVIQMDPPELGPINVKISLVQEQTQISFIVNNPAVKDALDQSAMRLREMFAEDGLNLVNVDVSDQSQGEDSYSDSKSDNKEESQSTGLQVATETEQQTEQPLTEQTTLYLVDSYV